MSRLLSEEYYQALTVILQGANMGEGFVIDPEFTRLRDALKAKQTELKKQGRENKPNATTGHSEEEIDILFEKKVLGTSYGNK